METNHERARCLAPKRPAQSFATCKLCWDWWHAFQAGSECPRVLRIGADEDMKRGPVGDFCWQEPKVTEDLKLLGVWVDGRLTFEKYLRVSKGLIVGASSGVSGSMISFQATQFTSKVGGKALYGCEVLASHIGGLKTS